MIARILAIAGSDSGGGAGIQADIKTITMLGGYAATAVTALTAQNTTGVTQVIPVAPAFVLAQVAAVTEDIGVDAIKIGMIGSSDTVDLLSDALGRFQVPIVFDPVMVASSGAVLADARTIGSFDAMARIATLVTPNLPELAALCGHEALCPDDVEKAATLYAQTVGTAVLVKGGHAGGDVVTDRLVMPDGVVVRWEGARIATRNDHGTGCTLSSAIATGLARDMMLTDAIALARSYVRATMQAAPGLGRGHGPMGHGLGRPHFPA